MRISELLGVVPGTTAVIGSGGKTTMLRLLAEELPGRVILTTSTHIFPFAGVPLLHGETAAEITAALRENRVICLGTPAAQGKLTAPALPFDALQTLTDYLLIEADGAHRLPLKAHAAHEPALPHGCQPCRVILVAGASGFGRPAAEAVHRPERFAVLTGAAPDDPVTPALAGRAIAAEALADTVFLNQTDALGQNAAAAAQEFAAPLSCPAAAGSLLRGTFWRVR